MEDERSMLPVGAVRRILNALGERERSVSEITRVTGLSQPNVSNHLARLRQRGWVTSRRHGRQMLYSLAQPPGTASMMARKKAVLNPSSSQSAESERTCPPAP